MNHTRSKITTHLLNCRISHDISDTALGYNVIQVLQSPTIKSRCCLAHCSSEVKYRLMNITRYHDQNGLVLFKTCLWQRKHELIMRWQGTSVNILSRILLGLGITITLSFFIYWCKRVLTYWQTLTQNVRTSLTFRSRFTGLVLQMCPSWFLLCQ